MKKCSSKDVKARSVALTKLFLSYEKFNHLLNTTQKVWITDTEKLKNGAV